MDNLVSSDLYAFCGHLLGVVAVAQCLHRPQSQTLFLLSGARFLPNALMGELALCCPWSLGCDGGNLRNFLLGVHAQLTWRANCSKAQTNCGNDGTSCESSERKPS